VHTLICSLTLVAVKLWVWTASDLHCK